MLRILKTEDILTTSQAGAVSKRPVSPNTTIYDLRTAHFSPTTISDHVALPSPAARRCEASAYAKCGTMNAVRPLYNAGCKSRMNGGPSSFESVWGVWGVWGVVAGDTAAVTTTSSLVRRVEDVC